MKNTLKFLLVFIIAGSFSVLSHAQFFEWARTYGGSGNDITLNVNRTGVNEFCITGTTVTGGGVKLITRCYNDAGNLLSSKKSNVFLPGAVNFIAQDNTGNTIIVCTSGLNKILMKFNPALKFKWSVVAPGTVANLRLASNGDPVIGGITTTGFYAAKYKNGNGSIRFVYNHSTGSEAGDVVVDDFDNVYVGGGVGDTYAPDLSIIKLTRKGVLVWDIVYAKSPSGGGRDRVHKLAIDASYNIYAFTELEGYGLTTANISASKFNSAGVHQWDRHLATAGGCCAAWSKFILFDPFDNPMFIGERDDFYNVGPNQTSRYFVAKLDKATGALIYFTHPDDIPYTDPSIFEKINCAVSGGATGDIYIGGTFNIGGLLSDRRWFISRIDQLTGLNKWVEAGYNFDSNANTVNSILLSPDDVYFGFTETNASNLDMTLEKFSQPAFPGRYKNPEVELTKIVDDFSWSDPYPNPFSHKLTFDLGNNHLGSEMSFTVYDISGRFVEKINTREQMLMLGNKWETGMYYIDVQMNNNRHTFKVIKQD